MVVDLLQVSFLASRGLAALVSASKQAQTRGRQLRIVAGQNRRVLRPLQLTGLDLVLSLRATLDEALAD